MRICVYMYTCNYEGVEPYKLLWGEEREFRPPKLVDEYLQKPRREFSMNIEGMGTKGLHTYIQTYIYTHATNLIFIHTYS